MQIDKHEAVVDRDFLGFIAENLNKIEHPDDSVKFIIEECERMSQYGDEDEDEA